MQSNTKMLPLSCDFAKTGKEVKSNIMDNKGGLWIKKLRKLKGHTQKDMAADMRISRCYLALLESGKKPVTSEIRFKVMVYYNFGQIEGGTSKQWRYVNKFIKEFEEYDVAMKKIILQKLEKST